MNIDNFDFKKEFGWNVLEKGKDTLKIEEYITPISNYKDESSGNIRIKREDVELKKDYFDFYKYKYLECSKSMVYTLEYINDEVLMWDDTIDLSINYKISNNCSGNVLIGGLGLGLLEKFLIKNENIDTVKIIEYNKDIIELISKYVPKQYEIIQGDFKKYIVETKQKYDTIVADIWTVDAQMNEVKEFRKKMLNYHPESNIYTLLNPSRAYTGW